MGISRKQQQLVKIAQRQVGLDDGTYRDVLRTLAHVESSKDLDRVGFDRVMEVMEKLGFRRNPPKTSHGRRPGWATEGQTRTLMRLWAEWSGKENDHRGLDRWLEKTFRTSALRFLARDKADRAAKALRSMLHRTRPKPDPAFDPRDIAWWRYRVIEPAVRHPRRSRDRVSAIEAITATKYRHLDGRVITPSEGTIRRWIGLWEKGGVEELEPRRTVTGNSYPGQQDPGPGGDAA